MATFKPKIRLDALERFATSFRADFRFGPLNIIPKELEDAMSRQAQAERERQSRIILSTAETEIAEKFAEASKHYRNNPAALHLRAMNMVFEGLKKKGSMVIVPSTAVETMGLGAMGGLTAFDRILGTAAGDGDPEASHDEGQDG